jgi:hypothetical protein
MGKLIAKLLVVVLMLKMFPVVPVETVVIMLLTVRLEEVKFLLASVATRVEAVKVATFRLPRESMLTKLVPLPDWKEAMAEVWEEVALTTKVGVVEAME